MGDPRVGEVWGGGQEGALPTQVGRLWVDAPTRVGEPRWEAPCARGRCGWASPHFCGYPSSVCVCGGSPRLGVGSGGGDPSPPPPCVGEGGVGSPQKRCGRGVEVWGGVEGAGVAPLTGGGRPVDAADVRCRLRPPSLPSCPPAPRRHRLAAVPSHHRRFTRPGSARTRPAAPHGKSRSGKHHSSRFGPAVEEGWAGTGACPRPCPVRGGRA